MPRPATGTITETPTGFRLRYRAGGARRTTTLKKADGYDRRSAQHHLDDIVSDVRRGIWIPPDAEEPLELQGPPTFAELADRWINSRAADLAETTLQDYRRWRLQTHLNPSFGEVPVDLISIADIDAFRDEKKRTLSPSSVRKLLQFLSQVLDMAEEHGFIDRNPMNVYRRNRFRGLRVNPERPVLEAADQIRDLLDAGSQLDTNATARRTRGVRRASVALMVFGGLRLSEATALTWADVDFVDRQLHIKGTKTLAAKRRVPMLPVLADEMSSWFGATSFRSHDDLVIATSSGKAWDKNNLRARVVVAAAQLASDEREKRGEPPLPHVTPHALRRTAASLWSAIGWTPPQVMSAMGHTSANLTLAVYAVASQFGEGQREALQRLSGLKRK